MTRTPLALLACLISTSLASAQTWPRYFVAGGGPGTVPRMERSEFADLDGDGDVDALTWWEDTIHVYLERTRRDFDSVPPPPLPAGTLVRGVALGDVDGDGDLDLAVCGESSAGVGFIEGFRNQGDATFVSTGQLAGGAGQAWSMASFADVDGNGSPDLLAFEGGGQELVVFWNPDLASTPATSSVSAAPGESPTQVHDLDGDGDGDLLRSSPTAEVIWHENLGGGAFGPSQSFGVSARGRDAGDIDGDGDMDVVVALNNGPVLIEGLGGGAFDVPRSLAVAPVVPSTDCHLADVDLDGDLDVAYVRFGNQNIERIEWVPNDGTGLFGGAQSVDSHQLVRRFEFMDIDGDGDLDVYHSPAAQNAASFQGYILTAENLALPLAGTDCANATSLDAPSVAWADEASGFFGSTPWSCGSSRTEFWFKKTVAFDDSVLAFNLQNQGIGPPYPGTVEIFEGTCGALTPVRCFTTDTGSTVYARVQNAIPLQTYLIRVGLEPGTGDLAQVAAWSFGSQVGNCIQNASFESATLEGWTWSEMSEPFVPIGVVRGGATPGFGMFATEPTSGDFVFRTGFDGAGPSTATLAQEFQVTSNSSVISFNYRAGWAIMNPAASAARTFAVVIRDAASGAELRRHTLLTAAAQTTNLDTGSRVASIDLGDFTAQTIRFEFEWFVPESHMGPGHFQLDNINCPRTVGPLVGETYCTAAPNSTGTYGKLRGSGSDDPSDNSLRIRAWDLPSATFGLFITSLSPDFVPGLNGASDGNLCVGGAIGRLSTPLFSGGAGDYSIAIDLTALPQGAGTVTALPGETWHFQSWFRDTAGTGSNLTEAVRVTYR